MKPILSHQGGFDQFGETTVAEVTVTNRTEVVFEHHSIRDSHSLVPSFEIMVSAHCAKGPVARGLSS
jgi:hypothetical protein